MKPDPTKPPITEIDLLKLTADESGMRCVIEVNINHKRWPWLRLGTVSLQSPERRGGNPWRLSVRVADGTTDFEHSRCYAVCLPLVGVEYEFTSEGGSYFHGYIAPDSDDFRVAPADWDPGRVAGAEDCDDCEGDDKHRICPEGSWLPPATPELFRQLALKRVEIWIGPGDPSTEGGAT